MAEAEQRIKQQSADDEKDGGGDREHQHRQTEDGMSRSAAGSKMFVGDRVTPPPATRDM